MSDLTAVSLFAGIGGFDLALERAGVEVVAAVEIDPACRGVLRRHFPQAAIFEDVTEVTGDQLRAAGFVPGRGIVTGGFPCQDLSVAGRRAGLGGARSGLFWHIMRLADELSPRWLLLENVPGLLSAVCPCPGEGVCVANGRTAECGEWRVVPPGRGLLGYLRWIRRGRKLFEWFPDVPHGIKGGACPGGCMDRHGGAMGTVLGALGKRGYGFAYRVLDAQFFGVPQRRERVFIAGCLGDRAAPVEVLLEPEGGEGNPAAGGTARPGTARAPGVGAVSALQGGGRRGHRIDAEGAAGGQLIAASLTAGSAPGAGVNAPGRRREDDENLVALAVTSSMQRLDGTVETLITHALTSEGADASEDGTGRGTPLVAVPLAWHGRGLEVGENNIAYAIRSGGDGHTGDQMGYVMSLAVAGDFSSGEGVAQTVRSAHGQPGNVGTAQAVRRLTPLECERLQGFPDNWTRWDADGAEQSDSARYRRLGNAVAVPVVEWISRRIVAAEARLSATRGAA